MKTTSQDLLTHLLERWGAEAFSFPFETSEIEAVQTHISIVILAGPYAYKIKKPVQFPFVDYSTLEKRLHFCQLEADLNRRLSEDIYLGVVPLTRKGGEIDFEGEGEPVEYAVKMKRLPEERCLNYMLAHGTVPEGFWDRLAYRLIRFYRDAARGPEVSRWAGADAVEEDLKEILKQIGGFSPETIHPILSERLSLLAPHSLKLLKGRVDKRIPWAREGHGDLRLEHIYYFPKEFENLAIVDCVEFDPRYRCGDPLSDIAFLIMDLQAAGFAGEAEQFKQAYQRASGEAPDGLLDFYVAYRHLVRGLVRGLQSQEEDNPASDKIKTWYKAQRHFLGAFSMLEAPERRPCLAVLSGLPGTGKSSLARLLKEKENFRVFSSDAARKELAGIPAGQSAKAGYEKGIYQTDWTDKTYGYLLRKVEDHLLQGGRAVVDASFWHQASREAFRSLAQRLGVPFFLFVCRMSEETARDRLLEKRLYASDADFEIYGRIAEKWEKPPSGWGEFSLDTEQPIEGSFADMRFVLRGKDLCETADQPEKNTKLTVLDQSKEILWKA